MLYEENPRLRNKAYWAWLHSLPGLTPKFGRALLTQYGDPAQIFAYAAQPDARFDAFSGRLRESLRREAHPAAVRAAVDRLMRHHIQILPRDDRDFPPLLHQLHDPPLCLYVTGNPAALQADLAVAIVGTRSYTPYGKSTAFDMARDLAAAGARIVSGLAFGIDCAAHEGALASERRGATIAVLPCGLDAIYPPSHAGLARHIVENGGALVSELSPGTTVHPRYFPTRNRLMAALGHGLLVVEAPLQSGVQHTVSAALDLGRDVFAVPHPANNPSGALCNELLRDGATIACSAADILSAFSRELPFATQAEIDVRRALVAETRPRTPQRMAKTPPATNASKDEKPAYELTDEEALIVAQIGRGERSADELIAGTGLPVPKLLRALTTLMTKGAIAETEAGNRYFVRA